jgi:hypothetical protein
VTSELSMDFPETGGAVANRAAQVPQPTVRVSQVGERVAPAGRADRNLTHLRESLLEHAPLLDHYSRRQRVEHDDMNMLCRGRRVVAPLRSCTRHSISQIPSRRRRGGANGLSGSRDAAIHVASIS